MEKYQLIDIHCHILPEVDDGADSHEMTCQMLRNMAKEGISEVIVTPHYKVHRRHAGKETIVGLVKQYQDWLDKEGISIKLYTGNELYYCHEIDNLLKQQNCCTLADSFYILVEFDPEEEFAYLLNGVRRLTMAGYIPVIAHVERYSAVSGKKGRLQELIDQGAYIQVNASSIEGKHGLLVKHRVIKWIKEGKVHFVASDAHDLKKRPVGLKNSAGIVEKKCGKKIAKQLFEENPRKITIRYLLQNRELQTAQ